MAKNIADIFKKPNDPIEPWDGINAPLVAKLNKLGYKFWGDLKSIKLEQIKTLGLSIKDQNALQRCLPIIPHEIPPVKFPFKMGIDHRKQDEKKGDKPKK